MTFEAYAYENLPHSEIFALYDEATVAIAERAGVSVSELCLSASPHSFYMPFDRESGTFGGDLTEDISLVLKYFLTEREDTVRANGISVTFDQSIPIDISTATAIGPPSTLAVFIIGNEAAVSDLIAADKSPEEEETVSRIVDSLLEADGEVSSFCDNNPLLAEQLCAMMERYVFKESTGLYETQEYEYTVISDPKRPLLFREKRRIFHNASASVAMPATVHVNGILCPASDEADDSPVVLGPAKKKDSPEDSLFSELEAMFSEGLTQQIANEVALEQIKHDITAVRGLIRTWRQPQRYLA